ncbi:glycosyltransferase family 2 protein [Hymenobacter persicinus]|uniref:glycosyltransferase family 2 protein n=1 Tax=Hymenobacter persicinus TaxID=2025506 RepID=UPI0013E9C948|nr:glycosyltransferase family 2 protein [Hymenobacter persicinus]
MPLTAATTPLALIVPCYNPLPGWAPNVLESLARLQPLLPVGTEVHLYLVNDGSAQSVAAADVELLRAALPGFTYLTYPANRGKGYALRVGAAATHEPICLFTDIDFPYQEPSVAAVYRTLLSGKADLAVGVRDADYYVHVPKARRRVSNLLRGLTRNLLRLPVSDTQCGLKGFNAGGRDLFLKTTTNRYLFDLELIFLASRQKQMRVLAVPVELKPGVVFSALNPRILLTEGSTFMRIFLKSLATGRRKKR